MTNPYAPPRAAVQDVLDPTLEIGLADRGTRLGAKLLDGLIIGAAVYLPVIVAAVMGTATPGTSETGSEAVLGGGLMVALVGFVVWLGFTIKLMAANGQSIGKKACGIKVVRRDGSRAALSRLILLRNVVNIGLSVIPLYGLVDALFIFGEARRCVHDYIADTIVVNA
jgi:uncharacterized RDD family membrane protein YckC